MCSDADVDRPFDLAEWFEEHVGPEITDHIISTPPSTRSLRASNEIFLVDDRGLGNLVLTNMLTGQTIELELPEGARFGSGELEAMIEQRVADELS